MFGFWTAEEVSLKPEVWVTPTGAGDLIWGEGVPLVLFEWISPGASPV